MLYATRVSFCVELWPKQILHEFRSYIDISLGKSGAYESLRSPFDKVHPKGDGEIIRGAIHSGAVKAE